MGAGGDFGQERPLGEHSVISLVTVEVEDSESNPSLSLHSLSCMYPLYIVAMVAMGHLGVVAIPLATALAGVLLAGGPQGGAPLGHALGALEGVEDPALGASEGVEGPVHHLVSPLTGIFQGGRGRQIGTYRRQEAGVNCC